MFNRPKAPKPLAQPDPADVENRRGTERRNRLATGGTQSTLLATAMERAAADPSNRLRRGD